MRGQVVACCAALAVMAACGPNPKLNDNRQWSDNFAFRITVNPSPPHDVEDAVYKIVVQDKKTGEPIETGQGRIFATIMSGGSPVNTDNGLSKGKEIGTYYGNLRYPTTGDWQVAIQFRRDSTSRLERVDWTQTVVNSPDGK